MRSDGLEPATCGVTGLRKAGSEGTEQDGFV